MPICEAVDKAILGGSVQNLLPGLLLIGELPVQKWLETKGTMLRGSLSEIKIGLFAIPLQKSLSVELGLGRCIGVALICICHRGALPPVRLQELLTGSGIGTVVICMCSRGALPLVRCRLVGT